jgi:1-acyl-sn-glycerol-3-phosphate acyltransferase
MKKFIALIRSLLFSFLSLLTSIPMSFGFALFWLPCFPKRRVAFDYISAWWCWLMLFFLRISTGIKPNIVGYEKLKKRKSYIIVGKHESTWETLVMHTFMRPTPVFILKKELLWIPFFGWCVGLSSRIAIDRNGRASSIKKMIKDAKKFVAEGHNIIIFPQGTRVPCDSNTKDYPYKTGFLALVKELGVDIIPMALNSGKLWKKKQFLKYSGKITMEFMEPIKYEDIKMLKKGEVIALLEDKIENKCKELNKI